MNYNPLTSKKKTILLILIIVLGSIFRFSMVYVAWIDRDEGSYLYDSSLLLRGFAPYKDYWTRNPFYLGMLAIFIKLFGHNLLAGRLLSVIANTIAIYFIYRIGEKLFDKNTGILVSFIYAFSPYTAFWNSLVKTQAVQTVFVLVAVFLFLGALEKEKKWMFFLNGLFFGIAFLIRESALLFLLLEAIVLFYVAKSARFFLWSCLGFIVPLFSYLYFIKQAGTGIFSHTILNSFIALISAFGLNYFLELDVGIVRNFIFFSKEALYLVIPAFIFLCLFLKELIKKRYKMVINGFFYFSLLVSFSLSLYWSMTSSFRWLFVEENYTVVLFKVLLVFIFSALLSTSLYLFRKSEDIFLQKRFSCIFCCLWIVILFLPYLLCKRFYVSYFSEILPVLSLITGFIIISLFRQKTIPKSAYKVFISSIVCSVLLTQLFYFCGYKLNMYYSVEENKQIAAYLKENTLPSEEIFTANNMVLFCAERRAVYNISHSNIYSYGEIAFSPQKFNYPTVSEIMNYIESRQIRYCLIDSWTEKYFFAPYPHFEEFFYSRYNLEKKIDDVKIYTRK